MAWLPVASSAVQVTSVVPRGNRLPEGGVHTTLGLSNISFGLNPAARHVLNSVYLHEAAQAGLDSAIYVLLVQLQPKGVDARVKPRA